MPRVVCSIDWGATASWVQAIFSIIAIGVAIWLPKRDRRDQRQREFSAQKAALIAISERAKKTIERVHRADKLTVEKNKIGWMNEEIIAIDEIADRVDLTSLKSRALVDAFAEIQEVCRSVRRRFGTDRAKPRLNGDMVIDGGRFKDVFRKLEDALTALNDAHLPED